MKGQRQAHSSVARGDENSRDDWRTPEVVLQRVRKLGHIGLDPCSNLDNSTWAGIAYSGPDGNGLDGLTESWQGALASLSTYDGLGLVFMNHPYSDSMRWALKMAAEGLLGVPIVGLVACRPDTAWWRVMCEDASAIAFWRSRITFDLPPGVQTYKLVADSDEDLPAMCANLHGVEGVLLAKVAKHHIYIEAMRDVVGADLRGAGGVEISISPAPFPSALIFHNVPCSAVLDAFGDVADVYVRARETKTDYKALRAMVLR